jgi:pimeloyl-ACP methyl ester carboxylesterase
MSDVLLHSFSGLSWLERPGNAATLVLLHGIGSRAESFLPLVPLLPRDLRIIAWDAPGYGESRPMSQTWPLAQDYAAALASLLDHLSPGPVLLLGHSLGALIAAAFARRNPRDVARLILVSPALGHGTTPGAMLEPAAQARLDELAALGPAEFARRRAPRLIWRPEAHPDAVAAVAASMAQVTMPGYGQAVRMLASGRLIEDARQLAVPTDVVSGAEDVVTPPEGARRLFAALPENGRGHLTIIPQTGHAICQQNAPALARALAPSLGLSTANNEPEDAP